MYTWVTPPPNVYDSVTMTTLQHCLAIKLLLLFFMADGTGQITNEPSIRPFVLDCDQIITILLFA